MTKFSRAVWRITPSILRKYFVGRICKKYNCKISCSDSFRWGGGKCWVSYVENTDSISLCVVNLSLYPDIIEKAIMEFSIVETFR